MFVSIAVFRFSGPTRSPIFLGSNAWMCQSFKEYTARSGNADPASKSCKSAHVARLCPVDAAIGTELSLEGRLLHVTVDSSFRLINKHNEEGNRDS